MNRLLKVCLPDHMQCPLYELYVTEWLMGQWSWAHKVRSATIAVHSLRPEYSFQDCHTIRVIQKKTRRYVHALPDLRAQILLHGMQAGTGGNGGHVHQEQELGQLGKTNTGALQPVGPRPFRTVPQLMHACAPFAQAESPACTRQHERQWSACPDVRMVARHVHCDRGLQIMARSWYCRVAGAKAAHICKRRCRGQQRLKIGALWPVS